MMIEIYYLTLFPSVNFYALALTRYHIETHTRKGLEYQSCCCGKVVMCYDTDTSSNLLASSHAYY
jgi:hypothetical protein